MRLLQIDALVVILVLMDNFRNCSFSKTFNSTVIDSSPHSEISFFTPLASPSVLKFPKFIPVLLLSPAIQQHRMIHFLPFRPRLPIKHPILQLGRVINSSIVKHKIVGWLETGNDWPVIHNLLHHISFWGFSIGPSYKVEIFNLVDFLEWFHVTFLALTRSHPLVLVATFWDQLVFLGEFLNKVRIPSITALVIDIAVEGVLNW